MARTGDSERPSWWDWELELSPHVLKRMVDRGFTEVDLRAMLEQASGVRRDVVDGRWVVETQHDSQDWAVILEPDDEDQLVVVITAYSGQ